MDEFKILKKHSPLIIAPYYVDGECHSIIITKKKRLYYKLPPEKLIEKICLMYGSTRKGRQDASRQLGFIKNPPIIISENKKLVAIELPYEKYKGSSIWVFDLNFKIIKVDNKHCLIQIDSNNYFLVPLSKTSIERRRARAFQLLSNLLL